jgi:hypothetical protein
LDIASAATWAAVAASTAINAAASVTPASVTASTSSAPLAAASAPGLGAAAATAAATTASSSAPTAALGVCVRSGQSNSDNGHQFGRKIGMRDSHDALAFPNVWLCNAYSIAM